jgi:hypothetical protein
LATESPRGRAFPNWRFESVTSERSLTIPLALAGASLLAFVVHLLLAQRIVTPWIMIDELIYSELAKSFADQGEFLLRDQASPFRNVAYPAVIAPAWLAGSVETAYSLARAINVALMVLVAVPVYFWGKRIMPPVYALLGAVLVLLMPSLLYSGMLMTENAFFLAFVSTAFSIALALERPTLVRQALVLALIALTCFVRFQALVLLPIYAGALALKLVLDLRAPDAPGGVRPALRELRRFLPTAAVVLLLGVGYVANKARQGLGVETGLGAYGGVLKVEYNLTNVRIWIVDHFAELSLSVAVIPISALILLVGLALSGRSTSVAERAFLAVAASSFVLVVAEVGAYASRFSLRVEERNMFGVAPLLFMALSLWLARGLPRPVLLTAVAAFAPAALLFTLPLARLLNIGILSDSFALIPLFRLVSRPDIGLDTVRLLMLGGGFAAALAFALLPRKLARVALPAGVAVFLALASLAVFDTIRDHSRATMALTGATEPSWVDEEIGTSSRAAVLYGATGDLVGEAQILWQTEFWNRSVETVYRLGPAEPAPVSEGVATHDRLTGRITTEPAPASAIEYVVAPTSVDLAGALLARTPRLSLYRIEQPMRFATVLEGVYADGWMVNDAAFTQYASSTGRPGRLRVRLSRESWNGPSIPGRVTLRVGSLVSRDGQPAIGTVTSSQTWTVRSRIGRTFLLPTPKPPFRLEIHTGSTFSPADSGSLDTRQLGAQVDLDLVS